jgi:ppGpp synthetase/RelA/SpoT-type nucleotidyltranferase
MEVASKTQIKKLGERIVKALSKNDISNEDLQMLQDYRVTFRDTIAKIFEIVYKSCHQIQQQSIVTYRIKRIDSIIGKLKRKPDMRLDRMIDIAGCRGILSNNEQVYEVLELLYHNSDIKITKVLDYIQNPQSEGYKSLHIYVCLNNEENKSVEIQLRTREQHNWATLVEITDFVYNTKLKESHNPEDLLTFHRILSIDKEKMSKQQRYTFFEILEQRDYINTINRTFVKNYISVRSQWINIQRKHQNCFYLIEAELGVNTRITSYASFNEAEQMYFTRFQQNNNANIVLTNIPNATYEQISIAYSNYMLSTHDFLDQCLEKYQEQIELALKEHKYKDFRRFYKQYFTILLHSILLIEEEIKTYNKDTQKKGRNNIKVKDWTQDLINKINKLNKKQTRLSHIYKKTLDKSEFFYYYCLVVTKIINRKCKKRIVNNNN